MVLEAAPLDPVTIKPNEKRRMFFFSFLFNLLISNQISNIQQTF